MPQPFESGIIEGFFGQPWSWQARLDYIPFLQRQGLHYYIYAPKADSVLRQRWPDRWSEATYNALMELGDRYHQANLRWGIGLNLYELHFQLDHETLQELEAKVRYLNQLQPDILAILFDDMRGDAQQIAQTQTTIAHRIIDWSNASQFIFCPTYYSDAPILDKLFGQRPSDYLETLGRQLDPSLDIFWTGPEICSADYPIDHLQSVSDRLGRKPYLWDNYPVNDSAKLCKFLNLGAAQNRNHLSNWTAGHAINPMNQAYLSQIPVMTMAIGHQQREQYQPEQAWLTAAIACCGQDLALQLQVDLPQFQEIGLDGLTEEVRSRLLAIYIDDRWSGDRLTRSPYAQEIVGWLRGEYPYEPDCLTE
jgi:hypothetical protein